MIGKLIKMVQTSYLSVPFVIVYCVTYNDQILLYLSPCELMSNAMFSLVLRCPSSLFCMLGKVDKGNLKRVQCIGTHVTFPDVEYENQMKLLGIPLLIHSFLGVHLTTFVILFPSFCQHFVNNSDIESAIK